MKILSKILLMILIAAIVLPTAVFAAADDTLTEEETWQNAYELCYALDLTASDSSVLNVEMTRGEFCDSVARLIGLGNYSPDICYYSDVIRTHPYSAAIYALSDFGTVSGNGDGSFQPDSPITPNQAAAIIIKAFGYTGMMTNITYPASYTVKANELKLFSGVKAKGNESLTRGEGFLIIENAADTAVPVFSSLEGEDLKYNLSSSNTAIKEYHSLDKGKGIISADYLTTLSGSSAADISENCIIIDGETYLIENLNYRDYLGYNVQFYYNEDNEIKYLRPYKNKTIEIDFKDVEKFASGYIDYTLNETTKTLNISKQVDLIYNRIAYPDYTVADFDQTFFDTHNGKFTLLDNDHDGRYDVIFVEEYVTYVVNYVNEPEKILSFKSADTSLPSRSISLDNIEYLEVVRADGLEIPLSVVLTNDAASLFESKDGRYMKIIVSPTKLNGTVQSLNEEDITVLQEDGQEVNYKLDVNDPRTLSLIKAGFSGMFIINFKGEICGITTEKNETSKYGYLIRVKNRPNEEDMLVKVLCEDGKIRIFTADQKTIIDGDKYKNMADACALFLKTDINSHIEYTAGRVIRYWDNDEHTYLRKIDTGALGANEAEEDSITVKSYSGLLRPTYHYMNRKLLLDVDDLVLFMVPQVSSGFSSDINATEDEDYFVKYTLTNFWVQESISVEAVLTDKENGISNCAAVFYPFNVEMPIGGEALYSNVTSTTAMVDSISYKVNAKGEKVPVLKYLATGLIEEKECSCEEVVQKAVYDANGNAVAGQRTHLKRGDLIKFHVDSNGVIRYTQLLFNVEKVDNSRFKLSDSKFDVESCGIAYSKSGKTYRLAYTLIPGAQQYDRANPLLTFDMSEDKLAVNLVPESIAKFFVYDSKNEKIRKGNIFDIKDYLNYPNDTSVIYIKESYTVPSLICVYN